MPDLHSQLRAGLAGRYHLERELGRGGMADDALREGQRARDLDPLSPVYGTTLAQTLIVVGRYDEALALVDGILSLDPKYSVAHEARRRALLHSHRYPEAVRSFQRNFELSGGTAINKGLLGYAYTKVNRRAEAQDLLRDLQSRAARGYVGPTSIAMLRAGLGDTTEAFHWLGRAVEERDPFLIYFFVSDPLLDGLKKDARGVALLKRMNLPATN